MSRSGAKLIIEKQQVVSRSNTAKRDRSTSLGIIPKKRDRSTSLEIIPKKKTKLGPEAKPTQPKPARVPVDHLRTWLAHASDTEVDNLTDYLIRKRSKSSGRPHRRGDTSADATPATNVAGQTIERSRSIPKPNGTHSRPSPIIRSTITKQDIDDA